MYLALYIYTKLGLRINMQPKTYLQSVAFSFQTKQSTEVQHLSSGLFCVENRLNGNPCKPAFFIQLQSSGRHWNGSCKLKEKQSQHANILISGLMTVPRYQETFKKVCLELMDKYLLIYLYRGNCQSKEISRLRLRDKNT